MALVWTFEKSSGLCLWDLLGGDAACHVECAKHSVEVCSGELPLQTPQQAQCRFSHGSRTACDTYVLTSFIPIAWRDSRQTDEMAQHRDQSAIRVVKPSH